MFFCCFQLWPLFPSDRLVRCSVESNTDATHIGALKTIFLFEVVKLLFVGWLVKILIDYFDFFLMIIISSWRLAVASTSRRNYFADKTPTDISHCLNNIFCRFQLCFLLLSCWLQTWMDGYVNYGEEFAGMSWRQVRRCYRLHILATSSPKRQTLKLQRLGSRLLKDNLHSSVIRLLKDIMFWYLASHGWWILHWTIRVYLDCLSTRDIFTWTGLKKEAFSWRCTVRIYWSAAFWLMPKNFVIAITVH